MTANDSSLLGRVVGGIVLTALTCGLIAYNTMYGGATYTPVLENSASLLQTDPDSRISTIDEPADSRQVVNISFVGNCIVGSMLGSSAYGTFNELLETEGPGYFLKEASAVLAEDDWTVCALGSVLSDGGHRPAEKDDGELAWYLAPSSGAQVLAEGSIDVVSIATDHTKDYGPDGYADTKAALEASGLLWGDDDKAVYLEKYGIRIGIYPCRLENAETDLPRILQWVENASAGCDFVTVYPHGHMGMAPDDEAVLAAYCSMIEKGADLVMATHSGTLYEPVSYADGMIVPSLGSFLSGDNRFPEKDTGVFRVKMLCTGEKLESWEGNMIPFLSYEEPWQPVPVIPED